MSSGSSGKSVIDPPLWSRQLWVGIILFGEVLLYQSHLVPERVMSANQRQGKALDDRRPWPTKPHRKAISAAAGMQKYILVWKEL